MFPLDDGQIGVGRRRVEPRSGQLELVGHHQRLLRQGLGEAEDQADACRVIDKGDARGSGLEDVEVTVEDQGVDIPVRATRGQTFVEDLDLASDVSESADEGSVLRRRG